jgi:hypothetical protein
MKTKAIAIQIPKPCAQNWDAMETRDRQKYCLACEKTVVDFSTSSTSEIVAAIQAAGSKKICGRLSNVQLQQLAYQLIPIPPHHQWLKYLGVLAIGTLMLTESCQKTPLHQAKMVNEIHGIVTDQSRFPLSGVKVSIANTSLTAITKQDGSYQIKATKQFDAKKALLLVEDVNGSGSLKLNYAKNEQDTLQVKLTEYLIAGEIMITPIPKSTNKN